MDNKVPLRDQLAFFEGVVHLEESRGWGDDVEERRTLFFVQDLGVIESWRCGGIVTDIGIHRWTQWWVRL